MKEARMAKGTKKELRNQLIYSIFVRNYSREGTFEAVRLDLKRIRDLGTDIIWLMPIHPIGETNRKGSLGSPYAIRDYRAVNPEYGTLEDFVRLTDTIHDMGMRVIIDVVYNHTSPDSVLAKEHPEWFYRKPDGSFGNKTGDWWDVIDLDYNARELWAYQIETLCMWAKYVDGFRCDVASLVPVDFWMQAREAVAKVRPDAIWLAESVHGGFMVYNRFRGIPAWSDAELYRAFDMEYDYDIYDGYLGYLEGKNTLQDYCWMVNRQEQIYPDNYVKVRYLENHDQPRAHFLIPDERSLRNWTAFQFFQKGAAMLYAGQEKGCTHCPSLFDKDTLAWSGHGAGGMDLDLVPLISRLAAMKKDPVFMDSTYYLNVLQDDIIIGIHAQNTWRPDSSEAFKGDAMVGIFPMRAESAVFSLTEVQVGGIQTLDRMLPDGTYENLVDGSRIEISCGRLATDGKAVIIRAGRKAM